MKAQSLPTGTITFLFTDVEGNTPLWERNPQAMAVALEIHNAILRRAIEANGGVVFKIVGDEFQAAFPTAPQALAAAVEAQRGLLSAQWNELGPLRVRMGFHTGEAHLDEHGDEYAVSHTKNRGHRVMEAGHGGQILLSQESADLCVRNLPPGVYLKDLGEHPIRNLDLPEHFFQVVAPNLPEAFPPLRTQIESRHNLPSQLTTFFGRRDEIAQVYELLSTHRLVTLTGSGGVGKTRLSLEVANRMLGNYPDGVWYVELVQLADPGLVAQTVAYTLGLRDEPGRLILDTLTFFLSSRELLLVLDNCEHLLASSAKLVDHLLRHCPRIRLLAASREALGVPGERPFRVPSLSFPESGQPPSLESLAESDAVRLFVDRARMVQPDFELTAQNAPDLAQVCQRLDGIPLALELAAARLNVLTTAQLVVRLEDVFRLLTGGSRTALPRHQTLRAAIDWSYRLLAKQERRLLRRLSVFDGGWSLEAAEQVCSGEGVESEEVLDLLSSLVAKSMVVAVHRLGLQTRYRLLETVRQYSREKLFDAEESQEVRTRHRDYFLWLAETAEPNLRNANRQDWIRKLQIEHNNLRQALEWSFHGCEDIEAGLRIAAALMRYWHSLGLYQEGIGWLSAGLEAYADHPVPGLLRARAMLAMGWFTWWREMFTPTARRWFEAALQICQEIGPAADAVRSWILIYLGAAIFELEAETTQKLLEESVAVARSLGSDGLWLLGEAFWFQANMAWLLGKEDEAWRYAEESNRYFRQSGDRWNVPALWILGSIAGRRGEIEQALQYFKEAQERFSEVDDLTGITLTWNYLAVMYMEQGYYQQAIVNFREVIRMRYNRGLQARIGNTLITLGSAEISLGQQGPPGENNLHLYYGATLLGAGGKLEDATDLYNSIYLSSRDLYRQAYDFICSRLQEPRLAQSWAAGQSMTIDQAVEFALSYPLS